jgi:hypothetical protein
MLANWSISKRRTQRDPKTVEQQRRRIDARLPRRFRRARPDRPLDTVPRPAPAQPAGSVHLLYYLNDQTYRRSIGGQLNLHEEHHSLGRALFYGKKGEVRKNYREGQKDQLGALGLVVNAICLWNTRYMDLALGSLRAEGYEIADEDIERLSPLRHEHINLLGRYYFTLADSVRGGQLRPLRNPDELED